MFFRFGVKKRKVSAHCALLGLLAIFVLHFCIDYIFEIDALVENIVMRFIFPKFTQCFQTNETPYFEENRAKIAVIPFPKEEDLEVQYSWVEDGGHWKPKDCLSPTKVAIIVPYRNRIIQLLVFLRHIHPFLRIQQLDYTIIIVEQYGNASFNKGTLMNAGFVESLKLRDFDCFIFSDCDMLPEDYRNMYVCDSFPKHMSSAIDTFQYKLPYEGLFGGAVALTKTQFESLNGYSNKFLGWGAEDDEMYYRVKLKFGKPLRINEAIGRYTMVKHKHDILNPNSLKLLKQKRKQKGKRKDGLNTLTYTIKSTSFRKLYTWYLVEVESQQR